MTAVELAERKDAPSPADFLLNANLYQSFTYNNSAATRERLFELRGGYFQFDAYCVECGQSSTFKVKRDSTLPRGEWVLSEGYIQTEMRCQRSGHSYRYFSYIKGKTLTKVGQHPSIEDIAGADLEKYRPLLKKYFGELRRANGLATHGIGIGSFVYLRRIFEKLIYDHHDELEKPVDGFSEMRMAEKISALKAVLPPALVKHRAAYGILSKGLHELDENTCREYFPVVRAAIIQILEQDFQAREKQLAEEALERSLAQIATNLGGKSSPKVSPDPSGAGLAGDPAE